MIIKYKIEIFINISKILFIFLLKQIKIFLLFLMIIKHKIFIIINIFFKKNINEYLKR